MFLRELRPVIAGKVTLYEGTDDEYEPFRDIFEGDCRDIPDRLSNREVGVIGAHGKWSELLDIRLKREGKPC